jgi:hypothetical protein
MAHPIRSQLSTVGDVTKNTSNTKDIIIAPNAPTENTMYVLHATGEAKAATIGLASDGPQDDATSRKGSKKATLPTLILHTF